MTSVVKKTVIAGPWACEAISATMIGHFVDALQHEARHKGGSLTAADIVAAAELFTRGFERYESVFKRSFDNCTKAREASVWEQSRRRPFDRILMKKFSHLFPPRPGDDGSAEGILSRRAIPGFNLAVNMMIGPVLYEQCQRKCQAIVERHRIDELGFDWNRIYEDAEAKALTNDVLVVVAHYFSNFEKRRDWFMTLVDTHLAPPDGSDDGWQFSVPVFQRLMRALFADLRREVGRDGGKRLRARYGEQTFETLCEFLRRLED